MQKTLFNSVLTKVTEKMNNSETTLEEKNKNKDKEWRTSQRIDCKV